MEIKVTKPAINWFKQEFSEAEEPVPIRFYGRYGGCGSLQSGFSLGMSQTEPTEPAVVYEEGGFLFFIEEQDSWYFKDQLVRVKYSRKKDEIEFEYEQQANREL
ncbi:hypothetical protein J32TS2_10890 [Shouchella clausii]|jgi:uncharacterized protein YneR|uniref:HesB/YadR/YfhF family protein n=1 Tax=Shouchella clausii TaxID=79880 RepID=UPI001B0D1275|nr:HesB/YadR/YfhF family protein [Shouchella clausii]MDO7282491.1 HesB/YadR/YfhF family protein [Shouchella clausii]MDO7302586.1 HesB/YadR/YfhF family protein [Shouchella clausii]GIN15733.1 hypothetical protein J32TS2_10890 [Shouchella clausii]